MAENNVRTIIANVKQRLNIVDFMERKGLSLKPAGVGRYVALCPFHNEKTPSFTVSETSGTYHCFGCGASGDIISYLRNREGLDFLEAVQTVCDMCGIEFNPETVQNNGNYAKNKTLLALLSDAWKFYQDTFNSLPVEHRVKMFEIMAKRGVKADNSVNSNLLGYAPADGNKIIEYLKSHHYTVEQMFEAGVVVKSSTNGSYYSPWRERLMFPICDPMGKVRGFSGRIVFYDSNKPERKYVNSSENALYHKRELLFCQNLARKPMFEHHKAYIVEGQFDVLAMQHGGFLNTVASSGTALTDYQIQQLVRTVGENGNIVFMFDNDNAGRKAALSVFTTLGDYQNQCYATTTGSSGKDASDLYYDCLLATAVKHNIVPQTWVDEYLGKIKQNIIEPDNIKRIMSVLERTDIINDAKAMFKNIIEQNETELWKWIIDTLANGQDFTNSNNVRTFLTDFSNVYQHVTNISVKDNMMRYASIRTGINTLELAAKIRDTPRNSVKNSIKYDNDNKQSLRNGGNNAGTDTNNVRNTTTIISNNANISNNSNNDNEPDTFYSLENENNAEKLVLSALINYPQYKEIVKILHFTTPLNTWFSKMLMLADKNSKIIPERVKDDTKRAYVKQLLEYANNINSTEDADASIRLLLKQRIVVMLKSQQQDYIKKQAIIAEKTLGNTTDPIILLEFDRKFRRDMEDFMNNINNVKQQVDKILA
jgi:hypothetical protein